MKTDIEIAQECEMKPITEIAAKAGIDDKYLEQYGKYKAKIDYNLLKESSEQTGRKADSGNCHQSHSGRGRKNNNQRGAGTGIRKAWEKGSDCLKRALSWPLLWYQGRCFRRWICPGSSHGGAESAFYRRFSCHYLCKQSAGSAA